MLLAKFRKPTPTRSKPKFGLNLMSTQAESPGPNHSRNLLLSVNGPSYHWLQEQKQGASTST